MIIVWILTMWFFWVILREHNRALADLIAAIFAAVFLISIPMSCIGKRRYERQLEELHNKGQVSHYTPPVVEVEEKPKEKPKGTHWTTKEKRY